jgi:superfamily II DNA/RNA helicase
VQKHYSTFKECFVQNENLLSRLRQIQIEKPSPVQEAILPAIISHKDIIIKDKTGSGKTLGLIIGLLSKKLPQIASNNSDDSSEQSKFIQRRLLNKKYLSFLLIVPTRFGVV